jgi:hypothetical protein
MALLPSPVPSASAGLAAVDLEVDFIPEGLVKTMGPARQPLKSDHTVRTKSTATLALSRAPPWKVMVAVQDWFGAAKAAAAVGGVLSIRSVSVAPLLKYCVQLVLEKGLAVTTFDRDAMESAKAIKRM